MILAGISIEAQGQIMPSRTLIVGTREGPHFAMKNNEGTWTGFSIDLWRQIAAALNLPFEFRELDLQGLLDGVADGSLDIAVAAMSITAKREEIWGAADKAAIQRVKVPPCQLPDSDM
jgi:polar amino acid transport system substrate-binding protein